MFCQSFLPQINADNADENIAQGPLIRVYLRLSAAIFVLARQDRKPRWLRASTALFQGTFQRHVQICRPRLLRKSDRGHRKADARQQ